MLTEQGAPLLLLALPDSVEETNHYAIGIPRMANLILKHDPNGEINGLDDFGDRHTLVPVMFWSFRMLLLLDVGILLRHANDEQKEMMIASIGPFWDANETWLVLGAGILLVAFPMAHGAILGELYISVALMLLGLILRGVGF